MDKNSAGPGDTARIAALSADQAPTAIIGCPHMTMPLAGPVMGTSTDGGCMADVIRTIVADHMVAAGNAFTPRKPKKRK